MAFLHLHRASATPAPTDSCFVIQGDRLLAKLEVSGHLVLPQIATVNGSLQQGQTPLFLGTLDGQACWFYAQAEAQTEPPAGWDWLETRSLLGTFTPAQMHAVSCARELHWWQSRNGFCGCCGTPTLEVATERAKKCPKCNSMFFPSASPAIIVAVTRGDQILLAHNSHFRPNMFSLLAGFVEPGETLEQAAAREVKEEVGIEIDLLRYISSQPWPFPNSLMLGFRAKYVSGELRVDGKEIAQAGWFTREAMPEIPRRGTVARTIIDGWLGEKR